MKHIINNISGLRIGAIMAVFALLAVSIPAFAAVSFNGTSADCATVRVRNVTQNTPSSGVGPSGCDSISPWTNGTISANPGDIIAVAIYYHNTGTDTATGTRVKVTTPQSMQSSTSHTISGQVSASNGGSASGSVTISLSQAQTLTYISNASSSNSTVWYDNGNGGPYSIQNDSAIFGSGVLANSDGIVAPTWADQGTVRLRFKVGEAATSQNPIVVTGGATTVNTSNVTLNGTIQNFNQASQVWFEFGANASAPFAYQTQTQSLGASNNTLSFSASASLSPSLFNENTTYYYRACGRLYGINGAQDICGSVQTFSFVTTPLPVYECNDGIDNDGDGYIDYPNDPGCSSAADNSEAPYNAPISYLNVSTQAPSSITQSSAVLNGNINQIGQYSHTRHFRWGVNYSALNYTLGVSGSSNSVGSFSQTLAGLSDGVTYYYKACATELSTGNIVCGGVQSFTTIMNPQSQLSAITTSASGITQSSGVLNGIAVSSNVSISTMFFEWGSTTALGNQTQSAAINASGTRTLAQTISGLNANTTYYYRVVAIDQQGNTQRGDIKFFRTNTTPVTGGGGGGNTVIVNQVGGAGSLFLALDIQPDFDNVIVGDTIDYTVTYRNIAETDLKNVVIQVVFAEETKFIKSTAGFYSLADHNLTVVIGDLDEDEEGSFVVRVQVLRGAGGDLIVAQANAGHDHPSINDAQVGTVPAYAINHVVNDPNRLVGLALFGGSFFPTTLIGWLILLLIIAVLVLAARRFYVDQDNKKQTKLQIN